MTSLSKIIKFTKKSELPGKVIGVREIPIFNNMDQNDSDAILEVEKQKILNHFQDQAKSIIHEAEQAALLIRGKIDQEKEQWIQEKQRWIEEAKQNGYMQGLEEGKYKGYEEYKNQIDLANQMVKNSKIEFIKHIEESEKVILELGCSVAGKILSESIEEQPEKFISLVKQAVKEARDNKEIQIVVHPDKYNMVLSRKEELDGCISNRSQCYVYANEQLMPNQCYIETENGRIDASLDSQLKMLKQKLLEQLEGDQS
jgi:flagellar assembly protein FliH